MDAAMCNRYEVRLTSKIRIFLTTPSFSHSVLKSSLISVIATGSSCIESVIVSMIRIKNSQHINIQIM